MCAPLKKRERRINVSFRLFPPLFPPSLSTIVEGDPFIFKFVSLSRIGNWILRNKLESNSGGKRLSFSFSFFISYRKIQSFTLDFCYSNIIPTTRSIFTRSCKSHFHSLVVNNILYSTRVKGNSFFLPFFLFDSLFISR